MSITNPIIIIDDDAEDRELLQQALLELKVRNPVRFFEGATEALYYLMDTREQPLVILADVNMPGMDGLELRRKINDSHYLHRKSIPFVFLTTSQLPEQVNKAFDLMVQGYFVKPDSLEELKAMLEQILTYWSSSRHPNNTACLQATGNMQKHI
jgi:CheY-like chemotaxis protein